MKIFQSVRVFITLTELGLTVNKNTPYIHHGLGDDNIIVSNDG